MFLKRNLSLSLGIMLFAGLSVPIMLACVLLVIENFVDTKQLGPVVFIGVGLIFQCFILCMWFIDRKILSRIRILEKQALSLANGKLDTAYSWDDWDEVGRVGLMMEATRQELSATFHQLEQRNEALARMNASLERTVAERTRTIRLSEEHLRGIVDAFPGNVAWLDRNLTYLGVNAKLADSYGLPIETFVGKSLGFLETSTSVAVREVVQNLMASKEDSVMQELETTEPQSMTLLFTASKFRGGDEVIIVSVDTTERHRLRRQLERESATLIASSKMSVLGEMAGGIAHEINNPLTVIQGNANLIRALADHGDVPQEKARQFANAIEKTVDRIARIVRGLRSYARDSSQDPFEKIPMARLVEEALDLCAERFKNNRIKLTVCPLPKDLTVECRYSQLQQILINLLGNAYDAVQELEDRWISVTIEDGGETARLRVTDSGKGIPKEVQERMFNPFFTTKEIGKGTGLGLSICKGIAESHMGTLFIDNQHPNTSFVLQLPKKQPAGSRKKVA